MLIKEPRRQRTPETAKVKKKPRENAKSLRYSCRPGRTGKVIEGCRCRRIGNKPNRERGRRASKKTRKKLLRRVSVCTRLQRSPSQRLGEASPKRVPVRLARSILSVSETYPSLGGLSLRVPHSAGNMSSKHHTAEVGPTSASLFLALASPRTRR